VDGRRHSVPGQDGVPIGLLTAGRGPALLLVHGGMGQLERWLPVWAGLTSRWEVTAMDRRGRGSSGDGTEYSMAAEFGDVAAVATALAAAAGGPVDAFGHSYGATCVLGAAASGAPLRRLALYEPAGPQCVAGDWVGRATALIAAGRPGPAMVIFLTEVIGLNEAQVRRLIATPVAYNVLAVASATLAREAEALRTADLPGLAARVTVPVLLLLGAASPPWAGEITAQIVAARPDVQTVTLPGVGHEGIDVAPAEVVAALDRLHA
jgi:pimeloyl-ACP methyl ester carboxylesterase